MRSNYTLGLPLVAACALAALHCMPSHAQQKTTFVNQELISKQIPNKQYEAILRGAVAQCRAEATTTAEKTFPSSRPCPMDMNPGSYRECEKQREGQQLQKQQLFGDIALGCMAKQGWLLKAQE